MASAFWFRALLLQEIAPPKLYYKLARDLDDSIASGDHCIQHLFKGTYGDPPVILFCIIGKNVTALLS